MFLPFFFGNIPFKTAYCKRLIWVYFLILSMVYGAKIFVIVIEL